MSKKKPPLGTGARFAKLEKSLEAKGAENPQALAAWIGQKKYGPSKMAKMAAKERSKKHGMQMGPSGYGTTHGLVHVYGAEAYDPNAHEYLSPAQDY